MRLPEPSTPIAYPTTLEELEALRIFHKKEIRPEMVAIHAINPGVLHNSPARSVMLTQHLPQHLVISGSEPPITLTGLEYELGKSTFASRMPEDGRIIKAISRYERTAAAGGVEGQPELTVIYQKDSNYELDVFHIKSWQSYHQYFGFENKLSPAFHTMLRPGVAIPKDIVFADTPAMMPDGCYTYGANFRTAVVDLQGVAEDGMIVSEEALQRMRFKIYETRDASCGATHFPLNLNGGKGYYKIFQEIGEDIRHDGLIMGTRPYMERMSAAIMGEHNLRTLDMTFDEKLYSRETSLRSISEKYTKKAGRMIDIQVIRNNDTVRYLPPTMTEQLDRYAKALRRYYAQLLEVETSLMYEDRRSGGTGKLFMSGKLQILLNRARVIAGQGGNRFQGNIGLQYRRTPLDEYTMSFVIEHELTPNLGGKMTGIHGDKGVICQIRKARDMPKDIHGVPSEIAVSSNSTIARSNWGRAFVPYFSAAARDLTTKFQMDLNLGPKATAEQMMLVDDHKFDSVYKELMQYYAITAPRSFWFYTQKVVDNKARRLHMLKNIRTSIQNFMPVDNPINDVDAVLHLEKHFPQTYGPITYTDDLGREVTSEAKVRIVPMYMMLLEKIADDGSATSIGKLQHHGILASQTKSEKYSLPYRSNPTRNVGEAEGRLYLFYARSPVAVAELHDRSNNPAAMRHISLQLMSHPTPSNIEVIVDRNVIQYGGTRPLQFLQHFMATQGAWIEFMPEAEAFNLGLTEELYAR